MINLKFDFGTSVSAVAPGYKKIIPTTAYTSQQGWGWLSTGFTRDSRDRSKIDDLYRDFVFSKDMKFRVDVTPGQYKIKVIVGDLLNPTTATLSLQDNQVDTINLEKGYVTNRTYSVTTTSDSIILQLTGSQGTNVWLVGLEITSDDAVEGGIMVSPPQVTQGETATLFWTTRNATAARINGEPASLSGSKIVTPSSTTNYELEVISNKVSTTLTVNNPIPAPSVSLTADKSVIEIGQSVQLNWTSSNVTSLSLTSTPATEINPITELTGNLIVSPTQNIVYRIDGVGLDGSTVFANVSITVGTVVNQFDGITYDLYSNEIINTVLIGTDPGDHGLHVEHPTHPPRFWQPTTITQVKSGNWSDSTVWDSNRVPGAGDTVVVKKLRFANNVDTQLRLNNLLLSADGELTIGSETQPIQDNVTATISFADGELLSTDTSQWGMGLISTGTILARSEKTKTKIARTSTGLLANTAVINLSSPVQNWKVGDAVVIPDTRKLTETISGGPGLPFETGFVSFTEERIIKSVSSDGMTITLDKALSYPHPTCRTKSGVDRFFPAIVNTTRNIVFKSEFPGKHHVAFCHTANTDIENVNVHGMGRTLGSGLSETNIKGRYSCHFHHCMGTKRVVGCTFTDPTPNNPRKWGLVVHGSHYALIKDNIAVNWTGFAFGTEEGNETGCAFDGNVAIAVRSGGPQYLSRGDERGFADIGWTGEAFWFRGAGSIVQNNIVLDCLGGYVIWQFNLPGPLVGPNGSFLPYTTNTTWNNNEAGGGRTSIALTLWSCGLTNSTGGDPQGGHTLIDGMKIWNLSHKGYFSYTNDYLTIKNWVVINSTTGIYGNDYSMQHTLIEDCEFNTLDGAVIPSTVGEFQTVKNCRIIDCVTGIGVGVRWGCWSGQYGQPRNTEVNNVTFERVTYPIYLSSNIGGSVSNLRAGDTVKVIAYNGNPNDNFQAFYKEQASDYILEASNPITAITNGPSGEGYEVCGSQEPGLTNAQLLAKYGYCRAGVLLPPNTTTRPEAFNAFVLPM